MFWNPIEQLFRAKEKDEIWKNYVDTNPAQPWSEDFKATGTNVFDAATWDPFRIFDVAGATRSREPDEKHGVVAPGKLWLYDEGEWGRAQPDSICTNSVRGHWVFNGTIRIPRLWQYKRDYRWVLWMSYTPQEVVSQRPGLRMAKGHVVVAGLGMGWLLTRVLQKKSVKRVTLVDIDEKLVNWLLPVVRERHLKGCDKPLDVIIDDAKDAVPKLTADVALWDIWESLGAVDNEDRDEMHRKCKGIGRTWFWGANARIPNSLWDQW